MRQTPRSWSGSVPAPSLVAVAVSLASGPGPARGSALGRGFQVVDQPARVAGREVLRPFNPNASPSSPARSTSSRRAIVRIALSWFGVASLRGRDEGPAGRSTLVTEGPWRPFRWGGGPPGEPACWVGTGAD